MKRTSVIIFTLSLLLFLLVQTTYYWEAYLGAWHIPVILFLFTLYAVLCIAVVYQVVALIKRFQNRLHAGAVTLIILMLSLIAYAPNGLINFEALEGEVVFVAEAEGAANCATVFKLRSNGTFKERNTCFGVSVVEGTYVIKGDTIIFSDLILDMDEDEYYTHAVIAKTNYEHKKIVGELLRFKNHRDTIPRRLHIVTNELKK